MSRYDVVVVGGGSAGCVLAARLSEDPRRRVLLLESGPDPVPRPPVIADATQGEAVRTTEYVRRYPVRRRDGSSFELLSGRIMGGGSAVNNMAAIRPPRADFDVWAQSGGPAWSYEAMLPILRAIEDDPDLGDESHHGRHGPMKLTRPFPLEPGRNQAVDSLLAAAEAVGLPLCPDINGPTPFGVCASPYAMRGGQRVSTASAYLDPARERPNLKVVADAVVSRIRVEGRRVRGVEAFVSGHRRFIRGEHVVLAAGVFHSPQVLLLSGIGPLVELSRLGIGTTVAAPGVGSGFADHAMVEVSFGIGLARDLAAGLPRARCVARSRADAVVPDLHVVLGPEERDAKGAAHIPVSIFLLEHRSTGRIILRSDDPRALPIVEPALLQDPADVAAVVAGIDLAVRLADQPTMAGAFGPVLYPSAGSDVSEFVRSTYGSYQHGVGTCRMGSDSDPLAVVDPQLRLRGLENVWVADASVLPSVPHANTNLATVMVAEYAARQLAAA